MHLSLDFETRSATPIKAGSSKYSHDAELLCVSWSFDGGKTVAHWRMGQPEPIELTSPIRQGRVTEIRAHNAMFERAIWQNVCVAKMGWPAVDDSLWRCTMAECLYANLPASLDKAAEILGGAKKDMSGRRVMMKMSKPRKPTKHDKSVWHEKAKDFDTLVAYCDDDVRAECGVADKLRRLPDTEQKVYQFDMCVNSRGVYIDTDLVEAAIEVWDKHCQRHWSELNDRTMGIVGTTDETQQIRHVLKLCGVETDDLRKETVEGLLARADISGLPRYMLQMRQDLALTSVAKYQAMRLCVEPDSRIRGCFQYHGASQTGRWAGRLVQLQNLPRGGLSSEQVEQCVKLLKTRDLGLIEMLSPLPLGRMLSSLIRSAITAAPGKVLRICDFAGVEARGLAWLADEQWLLDAYANDEDTYVSMASDIYHKAPEDVTKAERFIGKTAILGAGYQMGDAKFLGTLQQAGVEADEAFCKQVIDAYRKRNSRIRSFWYQMQDAAIACVKQQKPMKCGRLEFWWDKPWLCLRLPSGRDIRYYDAKLVPGKYGEQIEYTGLNERNQVVKLHTYGGKIVENLNQGMCRDLLVYAMSNLERAGYNIVAHVHDEVISEDSPDHGSIDEFGRLMCQLPKWAEGFPIGVEGFEAHRYRK